MPELPDAAVRLATALKTRQQRIVFAESCTAGLAAATLAMVPGVSRWLCGSAVTYRESTKISWLGVNERSLAEHGVVSEPVAAQMAAGILSRTEEADLAVSITGHLGPQAPPNLDGIVFLGIATRVPDRTGQERLTVARHQLSETDRQTRQREAACLVLELGYLKLEAGGGYAPAPGKL